MRTFRSLGRRVAELREQRGLTQEQFTDLVDVSVRYIQRLEAGDENLTVRTLAKFATVLESPVAEIFLPPTKPKPGPGRPKRA